jgi:hypothetical protein
MDYHQRERLSFFKERVTMKPLVIAIFVFVLVSPAVQAAPECGGSGVDPSEFCAPGFEWDPESKTCKGQLV